MDLSRWGGTLFFPLTPRKWGTHLLPTSSVWYKSILGCKAILYQPKHLFYHISICSSFNISFYISLHCNFSTHREIFSIYMRLSTSYLDFRIFSLVWKKLSLSKFTIISQSEHLEPTWSKFIVWTYSKVCGA